MTGTRPDPHVRRRCAVLVRDLDQSVGIPVPFDLQQFLEQLQRYRGGRPIELLALAIDEFPAGRCGLWLKISDRDVIGYPSGAAQNHSDHIVMHEVGHVVARHTGTSTGGAEGWAALLPDLDPAMVRSVLGRSVYTAAEEQEAELFASLIMQRGLSAPTTSDQGDQGDVADADRPTADSVALRVRRTFGAHRR